MMSADVFVILDTAQFSKCDFHHRNRIRNMSHDGYKWLTVPVNKKFAPLSGIIINNSNPVKGEKWTESHRYTINDCYKSAPFYANHEKFLESIYGREWNRLVSLNMTIIMYLKEIFEIKAPVIMASSMECIKKETEVTAENGTCMAEVTEMSLACTPEERHRKSTQRIIEICKELGADTYLSGLGGKEYMAEGLFAMNGIHLEYQHFRHPVYRQCYSPFIPNLSSLDYIMNVGTGEAIDSGFAAGTDAATVG